MKDYTIILILDETNAACNFTVIFDKLHFVMCTLDYDNMTHKQIRHIIQDTLYDALSDEIQYTDTQIVQFVIRLLAHKIERNEFNFVIDDDIISVCVDI